MILAPDTAIFPSCTTTPYNCPMKTWMRKRGNRVKITSGKYAGQTGTIESNVHQRTADFPDELHNGFHIWLDSEELVTVRWEQVKNLPPELWVCQV